jgi:hypothetical protein
MNERGEALEKLESKFADLSAGTSSFLQKVKELNEKEVSIYLCKDELDSKR